MTTHFGSRISDFGLPSRPRPQRAHLPSIRNPHSPIRNPSAFTMLELLIVVLIIASLVGILIPAIGHFRRFMRQSAIKTFASTIQTGLVAYQHDFRDLPPSFGNPVSVAPNAVGTGAKIPLAYNSNWDGGEILAQALLGPLSDATKGTNKDLPDTTTPGNFDDGADGYGFRSIAGKKSGPYIELKNEYNLRARWDKSGSAAEPASDEVWGPNIAQHDHAYVLCMPYGGPGAPFLYYRAYPLKQTGDNFQTTATAVWGTEGRFDTEDNATLVNGADAVAFWKRTPAQGLKDEDRTAFATELRSADYLIVHPGPDGAFGAPGSGDELDDIFITGQATH